MPLSGADTSPRWEIDSLKLRERQVFITGWLLAPGPALDGLQLSLRNRTGGLVASLPLNAAQARPDVQRAYPQWPGAGHCGFVGVGAWPRPLETGDQLMLEGLVQQAIVVQLPLPQDAAAAQPRWGPVRQLLGYSRQAMRLLASGQWRSLRDKVKRQLSDRPQQQVSHQLPEAWRQQLEKCGAAGVQLMVDHRLGGGANQYRHQLVEQWLDQGGCVLLLTYHLASLQPMLQLISHQGKAQLGLTHWGEVATLLQPIGLSRITYNTAVSLADPEGLAALLLQLKQQQQADLHLLIHDFYLLCPSHFLLNAEGEFCGIPDASRCAQCLPQNRHGFTTLFGGDLRQWRSVWGPVLQQADAITAFSQDSVEQLRRAYQHWPDGLDWLQNQIITVRPHTLGERPKHRVTPPQTHTLVIGIVGQIGYHKGAEVVQHLAQAIAQSGSGERICVIGSLEAAVDGRIVRQTGPYPREQLAEWIEASGANVMLFSSIWPETFSYVTQELIELQLPLACFNLGAPAERVRQYPLGVVLDSQDPQYILSHLRQLLQSSYPSPSLRDT